MGVCVPIYGSMYRAHYKDYPMLRPLVFMSLSALGLSTAALAETITPISEIVRGSVVTLSGTVERIADSDEFILADGTGSIEVYLGPTSMPVTTGEAVTVTGFVDDDPGPLDLCAASITKGDGTLVTIPNCDG